MMTRFKTPYRFDKSYEENYRKGPDDRSLHKDKQLKWNNSHDRSVILFEKYEIKSRCGIFSGPLLNSAWVEFYSNLGFDYLTYKTVRNHSHLAYEWPNCVPVDNRMPLVYPNDQKHPPTFLQKEQFSAPYTMTNSFGMPSRDPKEWAQDLVWALDFLQKNQLLSVSIVDDDPNPLKQFDNLARLVEIAQNSAHVVELNLSCPNVDGTMLCTMPKETEVIVRGLQKHLSVPLVLKLGAFATYDSMDRFLTAVSPYISGISGINSIKCNIVPPLDNDRPTSGVCGWPILDAGLQFCKWAHQWRTTHKATWSLLSGGGISHWSHIQDYLDAGADVAMMASGIMIDPYIAVDYHLYK